MSIICVVLIPLLIVFIATEVMAKKNKYNIEKYNNMELVRELVIAKQFGGDNINDTAPFYLIFADSTCEEVSHSIYSATKVGDTIYVKPKYIKKIYINK